MEPTPQAAFGNSAPWPATTPAQLTRVVFSACAGSAMEWYDFFIYGFVASLVFDQIFFPGISPAFARIVVFATFSVGFVARPLGGLVFAHFGDRYGRKAVLLTTMVMMGLGTSAIGLLPTYQTAGIIAPCLLIACRLVQGMALGGESIGALLMTVETAPSAKRGFYTSIVMATGALAQVFGSLIVMLLTRLPNHALFAWAWRVPFLLSIALLAIGMYVRHRVEETPAFQHALKNRKTLRFPAAEVLRRFKKPVLIALFAAAAESTCFNLSTTFSLSYGTHALSISRETFTTALFIGLSVAAAMTVVYGALSDRIGRVRVFSMGVIAAGILIWPFFKLLGTQQAALVTVAIVLIVGFVHPLMFGPEGSLFPELFDTSVRFSGVTLGKQFGTLIGGFSPLIASAVLAFTQGGLGYVGLYMIAISIVALCGLRVARLVKI